MADHNVETLRLHHHHQHLGYDSYFGCEAQTDCAMELEYTCTHTCTADTTTPTTTPVNNNNNSIQRMQFLEPVQAQFYIPSKGRMSSWKTMYIGLSGNGFSVFRNHDHSCFLSFCFGDTAVAADAYCCAASNTNPTLVANPTRLRTHNGVWVEVTMQLDASYYGDECDTSTNAIPIRLRRRQQQHQPTAGDTAGVERFLQHVQAHMRRRRWNERNDGADGDGDFVWGTDDDDDDL